MASQLDPETVNINGTDGAESVVCDNCAEEHQEATHHCNNCLANFCERCAESHGKGAAGIAIACHRVERGVRHYDMELQLCPLDGQKMSFYCRTCRVPVCPECEMDFKKHGMHVVMPTTSVEGLEKEKLLDKLDDVTTKTETISHLPEDVKSMSTQIELKWLERKELIRQEFASLFETLTTQQHKLLADMEEEVQQSLAGLHKLQQDHDAVMSSTCQLSDDCITAVQNLPQQQFITTYPQYLHSVKQLEQQVERIESPEDQVPAFLKVPFSLHKEKLRLHHCLQLSAFKLDGLKAKEHHRFVPYKRLKDQLTINTLLDTPANLDLPPSSTLRYSVDIYQGTKLNKTPQWSIKKPVRGCDTIINSQTTNSPALMPGSLYLVKIRPVLSCTTHQKEVTAEGRAISIVIVTDKAVENAKTEPVMAAGDSHVNLPETQGLLNAMFDSIGDDHFPCVNQGMLDSGSRKSSNSNSNSNNNNTNNSNRGKKGSARIPRRVHSFFIKPPTMDRFVSSPAVSGRGGGLHAATRAPGHCAVPKTSLDVAFPVPVADGSGRFCTQRRYVSGHCSFEEARLAEDGKLQVPGGEPRPTDTQE